MRRHWRRGNLKGEQRLDQASNTAVCWRRTERPPADIGRAINHLRRDGVALRGGVFLDTSDRKLDRIRDRAVIRVGAINAQRDFSTLSIGQAPFSNPGASILVSAPGSNVASTSRILTNDDGTVFGSDTAVSQGTSFAPPIVSGVVALMKRLRWRDGDMVPIGE